MSYERTIIHGIPFFRAADGKLYAWTADGTEQGDVVGDLYLGVGDAKTESLAVSKDWAEGGESRLAAWRNAQKPRSRAKLRAADGVIAIAKPAKPAKAAKPDKPDKPAKAAKPDKPAKAAKST